MEDFMGKSMEKSYVNGENMGKHEKIWRNNVGKYGEKLGKIWENLRNIWRKTWEEMGKTC
jgi:hypothetical protein